MVRKSAALIFLLVLQSVCNAQSKVADSLRGILGKSEPTTRLEILNKLAYELIGYNTEEADKYSSEAIELGKSLNNKSLTGLAYTYKGVNAYLSGNYIVAPPNLKKGLNLSRQVGDRKNQGYALLQLGNCYLDKGLLDSSSYYYDRAFDILKDRNDLASLAKLYRNLSMLNRFRGQRELEQKNIKNALELNLILSDKARIVDNLLLRASFMARRFKYDSANDILDQAELIARGESSKRLFYEIAHQRVLILIPQGKYKEAFTLMDSIRIYLEENNFPKTKVIFLKNVGRAFSIQGDYELALQNLYEGLEIAQKENFFSDLLEIQCELGWVTSHIGDPLKSLEFAEQALKNSSQFDLPTYTVQALNLKGLVLTELKRLPEAREVLQKDIDLCLRYNDFIGLTEAYLNFALLEIESKESEQAITHLNQALEIAKKNQYEHGELWAVIYLSEVYLNNKQPAKTLAILQSIHRLHEVLNEKEALIKVYDIKKELFKIQGKYKESLFFAEKASQLNDSIKSAGVINRFANLQRLNEINQRERNIQLLTKQTELNKAQIALQEIRIRWQFIIGIVAFVGIVVLILVAMRFRTFYKRIVLLNKGNQEQKEEIQAQAEELIQSNRTIHELNTDLEKLVEEKTVNLKKTNEELIRSNNNLQQFSYVISHNLRGPIARLLGLTTIMPTLPPGEELTKFIKLTNTVGADLDNIVSDLSKIINLKGSSNLWEEVNLCDELDFAIRQNPFSETLKNCIVCDFSQVTNLRSVRAFIQSIFYNLINNAHKYRSPKRDLKINLIGKIELNEVLIEIADNGIGIDLDKHRDSVFKLFKRFHFNADGRGLGLYLVREQIEALGGSIEIISKPDVGTTFIIRHPLVS